MMATCCSCSPMLSGIKTEYDKVSQALHDVRENGYGIVVPSH